MAKIRGVDHIAIAVKNIEESIKKFENILGAKFVAKIEGAIGGNRVTAAYLKVGDSVIVLDSAIDPKGFLGEFIEKKGEGLHHLGLEVDDLNGYVKNLEDKGIRIPHKESIGSIRQEILLSPKDLCGVVMQVIEWPGNGKLDLEQKIQLLLGYAKKNYR